MKHLVLTLSLAVAAGAALAVPPLPNGAKDSPAAKEELVAVVYYAVDSDELDAKSKKLLDPLVARAQADTKNVAVIARGHTEANEAGNGPEYGVGLSQRRAMNVAAYFYPKDLTQPRPSITSEAFGQSRPPAKGGNARRVEVYFGKGPGW